VEQALAQLDNRLRTFFSQPQPDARRIFHGRGRCYPGLEQLCIDWFAPIVLITSYQTVEQPALLLQAIQQHDRLQQVETVLLQRREIRGAPTEVLAGKESDSTLVKEDGLVYEVHPGRRQNAGLFLDTRLLRCWLRQHSKDCNVLNLFAYSCSLSVAALAGGARTVTSVDISKTSISWGMRNHLHNKQDPDRIRMLPHNLFTSWGKIKQLGPYELVIIDPPTRQRGAFNADRDYGTVIRKLAKCLSPGARIVAVLNSPFHKADFLHKLFARHLPAATYSESISAAPEFEESEADKGLKICVFSLPFEDDQDAQG
jgi:23S rRNA (cytosine1962-C5)-methyltransferase